MSYTGNLEIIAQSVADRLRLNLDDDGDKVIEWINLAYQDAVQSTGCLQTSGAAALTDGVSSYDLPAAVAWIRLLTVTYSDGSFSDPFQQVTLEQMLQYRRANIAGAQQVAVPSYALAGQNQIEVWPTPGPGQTMVIWYVYLPPELEDDDQPLILEPYGSQLLTYGACVEGARFKKDPLLGDFEAGYAQWMAKFQVWLNRREGLSAQTIRVRPGSGAVRLTSRSADTGW